MGSLNNRTTRWISGRMTYQPQNRKWDYNLIGGALGDAGLETIGVYVT